MGKHWTRLAAVGIGAVSVIAVAVWAAEEGKEEKVSVEQVPAAVKTAILAEGGKIEDIARKAADGKTIYEADVIKDGQEIELRVAEDGKLITRKLEGEKTEATKEAEECVEGAKALAQAKVSMVQALETALKEGKGAKPFMAELEMEKGKTIYDVELLDGDKGPEMEIDAIIGKVLKIESVEEQAKEDEKEGNKDSKEEQEEAREKAAAAKAMPLAKVSLAEAVKIAVAQASGGKAYKAEFKPEGGKPRYEIQVVAGDKCMEVAIDGVSREVLEVEPKGSASAKEGGWRDSFPVDKTNLVPTGKNSYFDLEPGHKMVYKGGNVTLTITVLHQTRIVDGVTTRIVEEREEKNGRPKEISRNYFAIDKKTNDVYYFGEDVDEYDGDKVSHGGSWLAGEKGAKFGLMMPAKPKVGDRFYQEMAPKEAMDRVEIISLDEELKTPAGTFKCVHVKETSAIERGVSHKWYAPGVGLVKDDEFVIAGPEKAKD